MMPEPMSGLPKPRILVVIVNYRTAELTLDALAAIAPEVTGRGDTQVVVTDNLSGDGSVEKLRDGIATRGYGPWCELMPLPKNGGFAYGNNRGIRPYFERREQPAYVWFLNPDTVARPQALSILVDYLEAHPKVGIAGSRLEDPDGTPQQSAFRFHSIASELEEGLRLGLVSKLLGDRLVAPPVSDETTLTDWVAGASMLVRRDVFRRVGLLDEAYFMYFEEVDFCLKANRAGYQCAYVPASRVVHLVGQASGVTDPNKATRARPQYWFDSRRNYFVRNHGLAKAIGADLAFTAGFATWRLRRILQRKPDNDPKDLLPSLVKNWTLFRGSP